MFAKKSFLLSCAVFPSIFAALIFDPLTRAGQSGILFLHSLVFFTIVAPYFLLRASWGFLTKRIHRYTHDVIPSIFVVLAFTIQNFSYAIFFIVPIIFLLLDRLCRLELFRWRDLLSAVVVGTLIYFACGLWLFRGMILLESFAYLITHFLEYFFPILFLKPFQLTFFRQKMDLPKSILFAVLTTFLFKCVVGKFSELDLLFLGAVVVLNLGQVVGEKFLAILRRNA